jgi:Protein of unknown function (DUF1552)
MKRKTALSRRVLLRGLTASASVGLLTPVLDGMLNSHGTCWADGGALPTRFGVWFFGTGVHAGFTPSTTGTLVLPTGIKSLERHRSNITLVSNLTVASHGDYAENRHHMGTASVLTGAPPKNDAASAPSYDQIIAPYLTGAKLPSLQVGVIGGGGSISIFSAISHSGPNAPNVPIQSPRRLYEALFQTQSADPNAASAALELKLVDAVKGETNRLKQRVGRNDGLRLDAYLSALRDIEVEIGAIPSATCGPTDALKTESLGAAMNVGSIAQLIARNRLNSKLTALALSCNLARTFTFYFSTSGGSDNFADANTGAQLSDNHHELGHQQAADLPRSVDFVMARFADFLDEMSNVKEGASTVLQRSAVIATTEVSRNHEHDNHPMILAGQADGRLKTGLHIRASDGPTTKVFLTAFKALQVPLTSLGKNDAQTSEVISNVLV